MQISDKQQSNIIQIITNLKDSDVLWLNEFDKDEVIYLKELIMHQTGSKGFCININDNHTKIQKLIFKRI